MSRALGQEAVHVSGIIDIVEDQEPPPVGITPTKRVQHGVDADIDTLVGADTQLICESRERGANQARLLR